MTATTYVHTLSGRMFTGAPGYGRFGASSTDGTWDDGTPGTIWTGAELLDGRPVWTVVQCSWCDAPATHNLDSTAVQPFTDACCDAHHSQWFTSTPAGAFTTRGTLPAHRAPGAPISTPAGWFPRPRHRSDALDAPLSRRGIGWDTRSERSMRVRLTTTTEGW